MYYCVVRQFVIGGIAKIARGIQDVVIEGLVAFAVWFVHKLGNLVRTAQSGNLTFYVGTLIVGIIIWRFIGNLPF